MAISDFVFQSAPETVHLFPAPTGANSAKLTAPQGSNFLTFQYWPQTLQDDYQVEYAEHQIPGGSHPLYQWVGGRGRTLTFQAVFTAEINQTRIEQGVPSQPFFLTPSARFTVNVNAALDKLRAWMRPLYGKGGRLGLTKPPPILKLVFPKTSLVGGGGTSVGDGINVILRSAPITIEAWFANGEPRIATVDLQFSEIVQSPSDGDDAAKIKFLDRGPFESSGNDFNYKGLSNRPLLGLVSL